MAAVQSVKSVLSLLTWILWIYVLLGEYHCGYLKLIVLSWPFVMFEQHFKRLQLAIPLLFRLGHWAIWFCALVGMTDLGCSYIRAAVLISPFLSRKTARKAAWYTRKTFHYMRVALPAVLVILCEGVRHMLPTDLARLFCQCVLTIVMAIVAWVPSLFPGLKRFLPRVTYISIEQYLDEGHPMTTFHETLNFQVYTSDGRNLWQGFIDVILNAYDQNKSWAGNFQDEDLRIGANEYKIDREATEDATYENLLLDLAQIANLLIRHFITENQFPPGCVQELYASLTEPLLPAVPVPSPQAIQKFLKFMRNYPGLKHPRRTSTFISKVFQAARAMGAAQYASVMTAVSRVQVPQDWMNVTEELGYLLLNRTFWFDMLNPYNQINLYNDGPDELFRFLRNLFEHGGDYDRLGRQMLHDMEDLDYLAAEVFASGMAQLVWHLVLECEMTGLLEHAWKDYSI